MIVVELIGLKKSGKTTSAEALIKEFKGRGLKVGAVKSMRLSRFTIDTEGKDTWRHKEAGADFVISLSDGELGYIERREEHTSLEDALEFVPEDTQILICEGVVDDHENVVRIVVAKERSLLKDTFEVRGIRDGVIAITGIMANSYHDELDLPVFNCLRSEGASKLCDLILEKAKERV